MSEKRSHTSENEPSPKVKVVSDSGIAGAKTPIYKIISVGCGKCERITTVFLNLSALPVEIQKLFDSIHYDSENCPRTEEAVVAEHEHSPEELIFKLQLKTLIEPRKWGTGDNNTCNDPKWLNSLHLNPGKRKGGKVGYLQDFDNLKASAESFGEILLKSAEITGPRVRYLPAGAILSFGSFYVPETWILEATSTTAVA
jgi:hypothetical protein